MPGFRMALPCTTGWVPDLLYYGSVAQASTARRSRTQFMRQALRSRCWISPTLSFAICVTKILFWFGLTCTLHGAAITHRRICSKWRSK